MNRSFGTFALTAGLALASLAWGPPALARDFVQDQAGMFSAGTVAQLNAQISNFNAQTGKDVVVVTVPSLGSASLQTAAANAFSQQNVNGVLVFIARDDRKDIIVPDRAGTQAGWFTPDVVRGIRQQMEAQFRGENYDAGVSAAVSGILAVYRQHVGSLRGGAAGGAAAGAGAALPAASPPSFQGVHLSMFWWIVIIVVGFLILRSILRSLSGPRTYGGAPGAMPPGGGMPGYGGYGAGPGFYGGGGGGFWSGLLGGLGGAWLGNELFSNRGGGNFLDPGAGAAGALPGTDPSGGAGWGSDAGQADMSGASSGDWSGGGFGGDGGGFGGDGGGGFGGGDSGGGW